MTQRMTTTERLEFLSNLQVGDPVRVVHIGLGTRTYHYDTVVTKRTPSGMLQVHGVLYNTDGTPRPAHLKYRRHLRDIPLVEEDE